MGDCGESSWKGWCEVTTKQKIKLIEELIAKKKAVDEQYETLARLVGSQLWGAPLGDSTYKAIDFAIDQVAARVGDDWKHIAWYIFDNDCGANRFKASTSGKRARVIDSVAKLVRFIEASK